MRACFPSAMLLAIASVSGCSPESASSRHQPAVAQAASSAREASLKEQIEAVRRGETDRIHCAKTMVGDDDLDALTDMPTLRELLLDESRVTDVGLQKLAGLSALEHLRLRGTPVGDEAFETLATMKSLRIINLPHGTFSDRGVRQLASLPNLVQVRLGSPHLTDDALAELAASQSVVRIHFLKAPITDAGLKRIHGASGLESLYLDDSRVTEDGLQALFKALPGLHVHVNQRHVDSDPHHADHVH